MHSCFLSAVIAVGWLSCSAAHADSQDAKAEFASAIGATKCSEFSQFLSDGPDKARAAWSVTMPWAQGYMAAWNDVRVSILNKNPVDLYPTSFPESEQKAYMARFCQKHPDYQILDAVINLVQIMQKTQ